jgi:MFS family permease
MHNTNLKKERTISYISKMKFITRTVWILSLVSLFTDMASEMLYPIMPLYLKSIGFSIFFIGILEGVVEATAGLSKGYFGKLADTTGKRMPLIQLGYALSAISKPLMAAFAFPIWVFFVRTIDRIGKGIRTGARDAVLSDEATAATKGKVFGFHRSMDALGAVLGPLFALVYLQYHPQDYKTLFVIAFTPGVLAIICSFLLKDKNATPKISNKKISLFSFVQYWKHSPVVYRKLVIGLLIFAVFNSSDIFLLLKAKEAGVSDSNVITLYIFYNIIYVLFAFPLGILADKIGLKKIFVIGIFLFAIVYMSMAFANNTLHFYTVFFLYGIYAAATEGISKAWISNITKKEDTATAIGTYAAFQSICAMLASSLAGLLWYTYGSAVTFVVSALVVLFVALYITFFVPEKNKG